MSKLQKISDDDLNNVSGGCVFNASNIAGSDPRNPWEVIDNHNGNTIGRFPTKQQVIDEARKYGSDPMNTMEINWGQVRQLRGQ